MVGLRAAGSGRTVYSQGSFAPTRGRVSGQGAQGYVQRQIRQQGVSRVGGDGQSDTRSGAAQNVLARRRNQQPQSHFVSGPNRQPYQNQGRQPAAPAAPVGGAAGVAGGAPGAVSAGAGGGTPSVVINANGQLELPYSPAWSQELLSQMGEYNTDLADIQTKQNQDNLDYVRNRDTADKTNVTQKRTSLNNAGGSGTLFSTAYGTAAMNDSANYQNQINQLLSDHENAQTGFNTERDSLIAAFKRQMQQQAMAYADETAANAGTLGYGQDPPVELPGQNTSAYRTTGKGGNSGAQGGHAAANVGRTTGKGGNSGARGGHVNVNIQVPPPAPVQKFVQPKPKGKGKK